MKIREYSDMHLDHYGGRFNVQTGEPILWYPPELPDDKETLLILAGDLWISTKWIEFAGHSWIGKLSTRFKQVLIVLGNHDYWPCSHGLTILKGGDKCNAMLQDYGYYNVKVLDCDTYADGDYLFVGCTLWTDMKNGDPLAMHNMPQFMNYDGKIAYETGPDDGWSRFTSQKWINTHWKHKDYIRIIAEQNRDKKIIVITHHLPLETLIDPRYVGDNSNYYYCSDLSDLILDNDNIKMWFYGHTHHQKDTWMVHCRLINNCVGYKSENLEHQGLIKHEVIEV